MVALKFLGDRGFSKWHPARRSPKFSTPLHINIYVCANRFWFRPLFFFKGGSPKALREENFVLEFDDIVYQSREEHRLISEYYKHLIFHLAIT